MWASNGGKNPGHPVCIYSTTFYHIYYQHSRFYCIKHYDIKKYITNI